MVETVLLSDAIRGRRVTRQMNARPVESEDLASVLRTAAFAPNAGNRRLQSVLAVSDPRMLALLRQVSPGMVPRPQAAIVVSIDWIRAESFGFAAGCPGLYIDVGTAAATMLLAAYGLGIGSCPVTSFSRTAVARLLALPDGIEPRMIICLGYPTADQPAPM